MSGIKLKIKKLNLYPIRSYNTTEKNCQICKNENLVCAECLKNKTTIDEIDCAFALGKCGHGFHYHCISRWLKESDSCPLCNIPWLWKSKNINVSNKWKSHLVKKI